MNPKRHASKGTTILSIIPSLAALVLLFASLLIPSAASAESAFDLIKKGNTAYGAKRFSEAISAYTEAIQQDPAESVKAYRNMAYAYSQLKQFNHAVQYYEWFFEMSPGDAKKLKDKYRNAKRHRKSTASIETSAQTAALERLSESLKGGPYMTEEGGGAVAHYELLMRTGYATPQLIQINKRLGQRLLQEAQFVSTPINDQPIPPLGRDGWSMISARVAYAERLHAIDSTTRSLADGLLQTTAGWQAYLRSNHTAALTHFETALTTHPEMIAAHWGQVLTLTKGGSGDYAPALAALAAVEQRFKKMGMGTDPFIPLLRANILLRSGKTVMAVKILQNIPIQSAQKQ